MANQSDVYVTSSSLSDKRGIWTVVGRYNNPTTGKISYLSKSTGYRVKDHTKRKAKAMIQPIVDAWNRELATRFSGNAIQLIAASDLKPVESKCAVHC